MRGEIKGSKEMILIYGANWIICRLSKIKRKADSNERHLDFLKQDKSSSTTTKLKN